MKLLIQLFQQHPYWATLVATWLFNNVVTAFVASFPSPTKDSGLVYIVWFKFSNTFIGNVMRAKNTTLENSPNWQDAVKKATGLEVPAPTDAKQP
jgi:hypothetical protein